MTERTERYRLDAQMLSDLWFFRSIARLGSVTGAAKQLGVTQGAVSQRLRRLEGRLGTSLFRREHGRLTLTDAGTGLLASMEETAVSLTGALARFDRVQRLSLVVSCVPTLSTEWLVPALDKFYALHPDVEIFLRAELKPPNLERMKEDGIDIVIAYQRHSENDLQELAHLQEMIVPVCSPRYLERIEAGEQPPAITRLHDDAPWMNSPHDFEWGLWESLNPDWNCRIVAERYFNVVHLTVKAALCDQGVALGRTIVINRLLGRGELVPATALPPIAGPTYRVFAHRPGNANSLVRKFAVWLAAEMEQSRHDSLRMLGHG